MSHIPALSRREFVASTAAVAAASAILPNAFARFGSRDDAGGRLKIGVIGCGGRGTGAAVDALNACPDVQIWALGDAFPDRLSGARSELTKTDNNFGDRVQVPDDRCFSGFDAYKKVLASGVDCVILATPPGFRPLHFAAAIEAGKHVFFEKPVAVDAAGIRTVLQAARKATEKKLSVVNGSQRRHEKCYLEAVQRVQDGAIGKVLSASVYWNQGGLWMHKRADHPSWSDTEWQLRNWLYFTWLSGDHITEQHVHNLDVAHWFMDETPKSVASMGGRQVRTSPDYGHVFDHFACDFEYAEGRTVKSQCRQIDGCNSRVEEIIHGTEGRAVLRSGYAQIHGKGAWKFTGEQTNPYEQEHKNLVASITGKGPYLNEAERIAKSTLMAIMGRMSAYTGKSVTWEQAMNSKLDLVPTTIELGSMPVPEVAVPGKTLLI